MRPTDAETRLAILTMGMIGRVVPVTGGCNSLLSRALKPIRTLTGLTAMSKLASRREGAFPDYPAFLLLLRTGLPPGHPFACQQLHDPASRLPPL